MEPVLPDSIIVSSDLNLISRVFILLMPRGSIEILTLNKEMHKSESKKGMEYSHAKEGITKRTELPLVALTRT